MMVAAGAKTSAGILTMSFPLTKGTFRRGKFFGEWRVVFSVSNTLRQESKVLVIPR
jgi:hypothetical protein